MQSPLPEVTSAYWGIGLTLLTALLGVGLVIYRSLRDRFFDRQRDPSEDVQKTFTATLDGGLPLDLSLLAGAGRKAAAPQTFDETYLRPTIGLRLIMFGFPVLLYVVLQKVQGTQELNLERDTTTLVVAAILLILMVHNIIYFNIYELRYDRTRIVHRTWFYQRVEIPASRLLRIRDDGMYFYILYHDDGKKAYIPKHLIGIEDFVRYVGTKIANNEAYRCPNFPKSKPSKQASPR